ncbi:RraA family protein [Bacillus sp. DTU_2020_1000418_1_SI_GHA_SEK_038]|uniref:RraA family protein n=1 Tax=Bacillus sp. DTU_2020_1000418_1_SI_GHA_SEK_038 TaxID=3077585 RepID=UPI0028E204D2|nr:RraA family protein [Bacillus sp. DTU_2020_1000418_1_SI_GHA_SEK_038]WNS76433.1 RraA family protein [Bacillus sp. DTU_2020_1000418_1_SI_GHA_SEK_038]
MLDLRIGSSYTKLPQEIIDGLGAISTTIIADAMGTFNAMIGVAHFNNPDVQMVGQALTVKTIPRDNLMFHKAIDIASPGDVIVVEAGGDMSRALLGDMMCMIGQKKCISGYVVDGAIRDAEGIRQMGFPVFAKGVNPGGPFKEGPGQINVCITCAGVSVNPGDVIVGDNDGVVVVPYQQAAEVLERAKAIYAHEQEMLNQIEAGTLDRSWIDETIKKKGLKY